MLEVTFLDDWSVAANDEVIDEVIGVIFMPGEKTMQLRHLSGRVEIKHLDFCNYVVVELQDSL